MNNARVLLIPEKTDMEFEQVFVTWTSNGGQITRLGKYWIKNEDLSKQQIAIYGNQTFALVLAQIYGVDLVSPDDTLIARLEPKWTKRNIALKQIADMKESDFPVFVKPVIPKIFLAGIFKAMEDFKQVTNGLKAGESILVSSIVDTIDAEARGFIMKGAIMDIALYEGLAELSEGRDFLSDFIDANKDQLPDVVVIDIAYSKQIGWFVLEFNACWGAGLNNCSAEKVIDCIVGATINK